MGTVRAEVVSLGNKNFEYVINVHKVRRMKLRVKK